jgi:hypothetical protein
MKIHTSEADVKLLVCRVLSCNLTEEYNGENGLIVGAEGIGLILQAMKFHTSEVDVKLLACDTLVHNLSQYNGENDRLIVDAGDIDLILQSMMTHATDTKFNYLRAYYYYVIFHVMTMDDSMTAIVIVGGTDLLLEDRIATEGKENHVLIYGHTYMVQTMILSNHFHNKGINLEIKLYREECTNCMCWRST